MSEETKPRWIYCNHCKGYTRHALISSYEYSFGGGDEGPDYWGVYRFSKCAGCDTATMEDRYTADYMLTDEGQQIFETVYYPKRAHSSRPIKHFVKLPIKLASLYREVIQAFNEELHLLCAAGLRALVEGACVDKGMKGRNLEEKIDGMTKLPLPESIVKNLHAFRFIGNDAVHDLEAPSREDLVRAIDVIEDVLNFAYDLDYKASILERIRAAKEKPKDGPIRVAKIGAPPETVGAEAEAASTEPSSTNEADRTSDRS